MVDFLSKAQRSARMARIAAEIGRGHAVSFVATHEIPIRRGLKFCFELVRACRHVEPQDEAVLLDERIASDGSLDLIAGQNVEASDANVRWTPIPCQAG
jgi:hypothetical protein